MHCGIQINTRHTASKKLNILVIFGIFFSAIKDYLVPEMLTTNQTE